MGICIKIAETTEEIDGLLRARHKVYVEEEGDMAPQPHRRIFDRFDAYPTTANFIVVANNRVVGGVRYVEATVVGTPADEYFDYSPYLPAAGAKIAGGSLIFMERAYRQVQDLTFSLMGMGLSWVATRGFTHVVGVANPKAIKFFLRIGFQQLAPQMYDAQHKLPFVPILLDMQDLSERFVRFVKQQKSPVRWLWPAVQQAGEELQCGEQRR